MDIELPGRPALLAYGFRPFFLLAAIHAAIAIPLWLGLFYGVQVPTYLPALTWHAHEMMYGFVAAAIAGFMLTAVPSWTDERGYAGAPLLVLVLLWLAGRIVMTLPLGLPAAVAAAIDLAFMPALALTVLPALLRSGNRRNLVFIFLLALLFAANLQFHLNHGLQTAPLRLSHNTMLFMLALLGGRVIPAFTSAALKQRGFEVRIRRHQPLDHAVLLCLLAVLGIDLVAADGIAAALASALAALLLAVRLGLWQGYKCLDQPILWILHIAYAWLPASLALKSAGLFGLPLPASSWVHALTAGAMASMIIGIMSRAALGHTGRALVAPRLMVAGYLLLTVAALLRVFGPLLAVEQWLTWLGLSAVAWCLAFLIYLVVYTPILCSPRVDGKPG